ncbi:acyltransferase family protein [Myxococcus landrumensis]|uniref:Acyltransferase n=1 Tax=Myxococcus landrumensis TaxID=2813577 RepID=A0ABX7MZX5_9BACT|nr:acyltransferase [Myxococcus landrumus]QSQ10924.1 acyltransferase [Myxococcus landrumus]
MDGLDLLRAIAILGVLVFHAPKVVHEAVPLTLRAAFAHGWMGVDLFFVLSGYLIGRQVFAPETDAPLGSQLRTFWMKRWMRTLPLYFVVLALYALKPWVVGTPFLGGGWHYALFLQNFSLPRDFVQSWSLCVEEHFYVVLPLLAFVLGGRRWPAWAWLVPVGVSVLSRALCVWDLPPNEHLSTFPEFVAWSTEQHLDGLAIGVFLARTAPTWRQWPSPWRITCAVAGGLLLVVAVGWHGALVTTTSHVWIFSALAAGFGAVLVGIETLRLPQWLRWGIYPTALLSYGAYLWHGLVVRVLERLDLRLGAWGLDLAAFLALTLGVSWVTYVTVEKPFLKLRDALLARRADVRGPLRAGMETQR